jgi:hypothetical protein
MTQRTHKGLTFIAILIFASVAWTQVQSENGIWSHEAKNHDGELAMVCGAIVRVHKERQAGWGPLMQPPYQTYFDPIIEDTILYFDKLPPDHEFAAVIKDDNRGAFPDKLESFVGQKACVYGKILKYKDNKAVMTLVRADQIAVEGMEMDGK